MEKTQVQRLAKTLKLLVTILLACNVIALLLVPVMVINSPGGLFQFLEDRVLHLANIRPYGEDDIFVPVIFVALAYWGEVWKDWAWAFYTVFLFFCGCCTAAILRQARRILDTVLEGNPFQRANAVSMRRAAVCCWGIGAAALVRLTVELLWLRATAPLYTYNTLFIPVFLMAGLLFLVMSALFRQAAELKEDQDLTI